MPINQNQKDEISRLDLKKDLQGIESFDISSFGQSKNQSTSNLRTFMHLNNNISSLFPKIDAPTLELLEDSDYNIRYLDHGARPQISIKQQKNQKKVQSKTNNNYYEDLTARNNPPIINYYDEQKLERMEKQLKKLLEKLERQKKQKQLLHQKINLLEIHHKKVIQQLKDKNKEQKEQIKILKQRQIKNSKEKELLEKELTHYTNKIFASQQCSSGSISPGVNSIHSSAVLTTSYMEDPSYFCPQLLSPEQTVVLLSKLLKKVSKSSKMIKQLTEDQSIKNILTKLQKK